MISLAVGIPLREASGQNQERRRLARANRSRTPGAARRPGSNKRPGRRWAHRRELGVERIEDGRWELHKHAKQKVVFKIEDLHRIYERTDKLFGDLIAFVQMANRSPPGVTGANQARDGP
jgi:hypothetical protein